MRHTLPSRLETLAQNGVVTTAECLAAGLTHRAIAAMARDGALHRLSRGVWALEAPQDPNERHLRLAVGILRRHQGRSGVTAGSALLLHGLPLVEADLDRVHLVRASGSTTRRVSDYRVWSANGPLIWCRRSPSLTAPVLTATVAMSIVHAGLAHGPTTALCAADAALAGGLTTSEELAAACDSLRIGAKGSGQVRRTLVSADGRHESPGETLTARLCRELGVRVVPQVRVGPWRVDFLIEGTRVIIEFDGAVKYDDREALIAEKRREDDLRARGYVVIRLMWSDLASPQLVRSRIAQALRLERAAG